MYYLHKDIQINQRNIIESTEADLHIYEYFIDNKIGRAEEKGKFLSVNGP